MKTTFRTLGILPSTAYSWRYNWTGWSWWRYPDRTSASGILLNH